MEYRELGNTGLIVSRLCFGALTVGPLQRRMSPQDGGAVIRRALELGVNFIDTAELYGTYPHIREGTQGFVGKRPIMVATKSYAYTKEGMRKSLELARRELGSDVMLMFLLHEQESIHTLRGHWPAVEYLLEAKSRGIIQAVGISTHHVAAVNAAAEIPEIDVISPLINSTGIGIQDGTRDDMLKAMARAASRGKGLYAMKPLGGGHLLPDWSQALQFAVDQENLHSIAVGMKSVAEVEHNIAFFNGEKNLRKPDFGERKLHIDDWCQACGRCVEACPNNALEIVDGRATVVDPGNCVFCGYCGASCPEFAIKVI